MLAFEQSGTTATAFISRVVGSNRQLQGREPVITSAFPEVREGITAKMVREKSRDARKKVSATETPVPKLQRCVSTERMCVDRTKRTHSEDSHSEDSRLPPSRIRPQQETNPADEGNKPDRDRRKANSTQSFWTRNEQGCPPEIPNSHASNTNRETSKCVRSEKMQDSYGGAHETGGDHSTRPSPRVSGARELRHFLHTPVQHRTTSLFPMSTLRPTQQQF